MQLLLRCEKCRVTINLGNLPNLPQPSILMAELADALHEHSCIGVDTMTKRD